MREPSETLQRYLRIAHLPLRHSRARALVSEARVRATLDSLLEGFQIIDRQWRYVYVNAAAARHGGKTAKELVGRSMMEVYPGIDRTPLFETLRRCMQDRVREAIENEFVFPDGSTSWFQLAIQPVAEGLFILSVDITERKRAEAALQETQSRFNAFMDASPTITWMKDERGRYLYMNRAWKEVLGLDQEAAAGVTVFDVVADAAATKIVDLEAQVRSTNLPLEVIQTTQHEGRKRSWNTIRFPFRGPSGQQFVGGIAVDITSQKQAEAAVRRAQAQLQVVIDNLEEGLVISDLTGNVLHWNEAAARMHGLPAPNGLTVQEGWGEELSPFSDLFQLISLEGKPLAVEEWPISRVLRGEPVRNVHAIVRRKDGTPEKVFSYSGSTVRYGDDEQLAFLTIADITDQQRVEEQLTTMNERMQQLLEHSSAVIVALRVRGDEVTTQYVSGHITRLLGFTREETMAPGWWSDRLHPEDRESAAARMALVTRDGFSRHEYRLRHKDGTYRWVDDSLSVAQLLPDGSADVVGVLTDITEHRRAQDYLRESERRFRGMLGNLGLIAIMLDSEARITYCNDHLLWMTGWTREELLCRDWFTIFVPESARAEARATFTNLLADVPQAWHHQNEILTRSGKRRLIQWNNSVLRSPLGEVIGIASIGEDVTERKDLERQIVRKQRLESLGTLAGGIAHDLNNILMPIVMGATLLRRFEPGPQAVKAIDNIERSVKRGSDLVKQVLLFARGGETSRSIVDLRPVMRDLEAMVRSTFPKNVAFEVVVADSLAQVLADATQIVQVLLNLCVNARDAMPRGGRLTVSASNVFVSEVEARANGSQRGGPHVALEVSDTGEGMAKEVLDRIFDPFFTTKEIGKGTGLGLSTAQGIVTSHGGFITVTSTPGEGTSFRVYLPAIVAPPTEDLPPEELDTDGNGERILLVDDDPAILDITQEMLEASGYQVWTAENGAQAIELYTQRQSEIDLVITDISMPQVDGIQLIATLKRMNPAVCIIAATGNTSAAWTTKIREVGVTNILSKPFTHERMLQIVAEALVPSRH